MKRILITGDNSYIGRSFTEYVKKWSDQYIIEEICVKDDAWKTVDFSKYNVLFHVAGIVHIKEDDSNRDMYYKVNHKLAIDIAQKAKNDGVEQFIFLSSGTIYGKETGIITKDTPIDAKTNYGKSKALAERDLNELRDITFKVVILRPLMVYGNGCKGNFQTLVKLVEKLPIFPAIHNKRSLIYIDNLSSFVKMTIDNGLDGTYFPMNAEDADIYVIAQEIAKAKGKRLIMSRFAGRCVNVVKNYFGITRKAFGDKYYLDTEEFDFKYCVVGFKESIKRSV